MRFFPVAVLAATLAGCSSRPVPREPERFQPSLNYDTTWGRVIEIFGINGWPIAAIEKGSGVITSDWMYADGSILDCGILFGNPIKGGEIKIGAIVARMEEEGTITVTVNVSGRKVSSSSGAYTIGNTTIGGSDITVSPCYSTGLVESLFAQALEIPYTPPFNKARIKKTKPRGRSEGN